ncbi:MAG: hypothetical protein DHS20C11_05730 [Lysobacteraceae bacterium]|nr:MAG: hypothetical protein DHS20C11_05730 [Xanthomonadaceae bacterium]
MRRTFKTTLSVIAALSLSACVIDARRADTALGEPRIVERDIAPDTRLEIRIPAGDLDISAASTDGRLRAEARVRCPDLESKCAKRLADLDFVLEQRDGRLKLGFNHNSSWSFREGEIRVRVDVPPTQSLLLDVTGGDVSIKDVDTCLTVNMEAGDLRVDLPADNVRSALVDTGMGDASLVVKGRTYSRRSMLVGAEGEWMGGAGHCDIDIDLQAGDARVELY